MATIDNNAQGITIYFEGNDVKFKNSAADIKKALELLQKETKVLMKEFKNTGDIEKFKEAIANLSNEQIVAARSAQAWADEAAAMKDEYGAFSKEYKNALKQWEVARDKLAKIEIKLKENARLLDLFTRTDGIGRLNDFLQKTGDSLLEVSEVTGEIGNAFERISRAAQNRLREAVNIAIDFEDAFAGVRKTLSLMEDEDEETVFGQIYDDLVELSKIVPTTADELAKIAEVAGQMGVGSKDIVDFTEAMVDFGNSTNITSTQAAESIAQIYNVIGKGGDYSNLENLLSVIVDLGNNSATDEARIVEMMLNIAAAASRVGMTEPQMAALAATLASLNLDKGGASAISTIMTKIDMAVATNADSLKDWADAAGMSVKEFKNLWGEDAASALMTLLENLKQTTDAGGNLNQVFDDLNIKEMRRVDTMGRLVNASDVYTNSMQRADKAFTEGNALSIEASKRYETVASKIQIMKNNFSAFALQIGNVFMPIIEKVVDIFTQIGNWLSQLSPVANTVIAIITAVTAAIAPLMAGISLLSGSLGKFLKDLLPNIITKTSAFGKVMTFLKEVFHLVVSPVGAFIAVLVALYASSEEVRDAVNQLVSAIGSYFVAVIKAAWQVLRLLFTLLGGVVDVVKEMWKQFMMSDGGQQLIKIIQDVCKWLSTLIGWFEKAVSWVGKLFGGISDTLSGASRLNSEMENSGFNGRRYIPIDMSSGGYMADGYMATGMTFNNTFTITGINNIDQATANRLADMMTNRINDNLGRRYA